MPASKRSRLRDLCDLASELDVSAQSVYQARKRGLIGGIVEVGRLVKLRHEAFEYHAVRGYGPGVEPWSPGIEAAENSAIS